MGILFFVTFASEAMKVNLIKRNINLLFSFYLQTIVCVYLKCGMILKLGLKYFSPT